MSEQKIFPIHVGMALKSLRNTDFDVNSAICEVIDNSVQADATEIKIKIEEKTPPGKRTPRPTTISFGDDGAGMDPELLQLCLKLGYSGRYDNRKGIGRFGVGMTFGAISLCQKIEVYSRPKRGNWNYTYLDISGIDKNNEPEIQKIEQKDLPKEYEELVGDFGTLVIWSKIDRIETQLKKDELMHVIGRIYRKYTGKKIIKDKKIIENNNIRKIFINNEIVHAHDPLFVTKSTKFPDDEIAKIDDEITFPWNVHEVDAPIDGEKRGTITIRTSLLPKSWRQIRSKAGRIGSGRSPDNLRRKVDGNEGFSILRNGREVYYDTIPNFSPTPIAQDRFWSCEIDFDPVLDHWFSVRNIKIGARPLKELREELQKKVQGSINHFREQIAKTFDEYDNEQNKSEQGPVLGHKSKEDEIKSKTAPLVTNLSKDEIEKNIDQYAEQLFDNEKDQEDYKKEVLDPKTKYKIIEDQFARSDGPFIDVVPNLGTKVVHYNMNHPFFLKINSNITELKKQIEEKMAEDSELIKLSSELKSDLDNLIYAYAEGIYDLDDLERNQKVRETLDELMVKWSYHLRKSYKS